MIYDKGIKLLHECSKFEQKEIKLQQLVPVMVLAVDLIAADNADGSLG